MTVLLLAMKIQYPKHIFLIRGKFEQASESRINGFYDAFRDGFKGERSTRLGRQFCDVFAHMPVAAVVGDNLCTGGGLACDTEKFTNRGMYWTTTEELKNLSRPDSALFDSFLSTFLDTNFGISACCCEDVEFAGFSADRGADYYGCGAVAKVLHGMGLQRLVIGGVTRAGYEFVGENVLQILSARNYRDQENPGAFGCLESDGKLTIEVFPM